MGGRLRPRSMEPRSLVLNSSGRPLFRPGAMSGSSDEDPYSVAGSGSREEEEETRSIADWENINQLQLLQ